MKGSFLILWFLFILVGCETFEYHPYDTRLESKYQDINRKNIEKIRMQDRNQDTVRFVFTGDSQRWYDETEDMVEAINSRQGIDFVVHGGDITDFGLKKEFCWIHDILSRLKMPYVAIVGNHDLLGTGGDIYRVMYGDLNFAFNYAGIKFVCLNTNALEFDYATPVPDFEFIRHEIADTLNANYQQTIVMMHTQPGNVVFNNNVKHVFHEYLKRFRNLKFCLHAHEHHLMKSDMFGDGIVYYGSDAIKNRNYLLFTVTRENYSYEVVYF